MFNFTYEQLINDVKKFCNEANEFNTEYYYSLKVRTVSQVKRAIWEFVTQDYPVTIVYIDSNTKRIIEKPKARSRVKKLIYVYNEFSIIPAIKAKIYL